MNPQLDSAPCGFITFAEDGSVLEVNRTLLEMLGYERSEVVGSRIEHLFTTGSRIFYQTHWFPLLRLNGSAEEIFHLMRARTGEEVGVLSYARRDETVQPARYACVFVRVRERARYEEELLRAKRAAEASNAQLEEQAVELELQQDQLREQTERAEAAAAQLRAANAQLQVRTEEAELLRVLAEQGSQAKTAFLASISHELRTPLNAISGYLQILQAGIPGPLNAEQLKITDRIEKSSAHLLRLIEELLNTARIEAGRVEYELRDVTLEEVSADIFPMIEPQLAAKDIAFVHEVQPGMRVRADVAKVHQILLNLLSNAAKFTSAGGKVTVEASRDSAADAVLVHVRDTGVGVAPEDWERIFQPYAQAESGRAAAEKGWGLGLAISREFARGMGGDLTVTSEPGRGSTFTLRLPRGG